MSLADALKGIKETQAPPAVLKPARAEPAEKKTPRLGKARVEVAPIREVTIRRPTGKSANPDYEKLGLYVRKDLRRNAERKFEDEGGRDLSDLLENLLTKYLNA